MKTDVIVLRNVKVTCRVSSKSVHRGCWVDHRQEFNGKAEAYAYIKGLARDEAIEYRIRILTNSVENYVFQATDKAQAQALVKERSAAAADRIYNLQLLSASELDELIDDQLFQN
jgi:hypothetical protein